MALNHVPVKFRRQVGVAIATVTLFSGLGGFGAAPAVASVEPAAKLVTAAVPAFLPPLTTAQPTIDITAPVTDQVLTADPGAWGPGVVTFAYRWFNDGDPIPGATAKTYTVRPADVGDRLQVKVTGSELGYRTAVRYSLRTSVVTKAAFSAQPVPTITFAGTTPRVGKKLTAVTGTWTPTPKWFSYRWFRGPAPILNATKRTYTLVGADKNKAISVKVTAHRPGYVVASKTSAPTAAVQPGLTTVVPRLSDLTPKVDQVLSVTNTDKWVAPNAATVTLAYQWFVGGAKIPFATNPTYTVRPVDLGAKIRVRVTGSADDFASVTRWSATTWPVTRAVFTTKPKPTITGTPMVGQTLSAVAGTWVPTPDSLTYRWYRNGHFITGATAANYVLTVADKGTKISVKVIAHRAGYRTAHRTSLPTAVVTG